MGAEMTIEMTQIASRDSPERQSDWQRRGVWLRCRQGASTADGVKDAALRRRDELYLHER